MLSLQAIRCALVLLSLGSWPARLAAECMSLVKGPMVLDVQSCGQLAPEQTFSAPREELTFIKYLSAADKKKFFDSYRGLIIKALVAKSDAIRDGLSPEKGVLIGETISVFVPPGISSCQKLMGQRLAIKMNQACCDGGGDPPCLLSSTYTFTEFTLQGAASNDVTQRKGQKKSPEYIEAEAHLRKKDYAKAAQLYEKLRKAQTLDIVGLYNLSLCYRQLDKCAAAVPPLTTIFQQGTQNRFWADEEPIIRKANFLLARCYSKLNIPEKAAVILNGYLIDPKKYKSEIDLSLKHKDFGWIHTSKEYLGYAEQARKLRKD